ncbi:protein of unknown function DUF1552 [Chthoniobacter flavus Ellin428]|uniref:DUF1552 domain-containing protein n=1 Tax=Chthoniobacter flavus Ellin428 TaxID=497964 RepID=B4D7Q5_9BACT|nr:DUF1552 domain-containing protein [Chthoniobacter flavus]EDY17545.1 protein of unknown function DUF1552 [Chthoniobacter flavus Ellin428]TCO92422.1 uncharacterized protein DUF1552 [Chthoniobacter flavus]
MNRRSFLRGTGACMALPFLESLLPRAARAALAGRPPLRMGIFTVTGGTVLESWKPAAEGALTTLPSILRPLEFAKNDILVLTGLSQNGKAEGKFNGHTHAATLHLTASDVVKEEGGKITASVSVDQAAAQIAGKETFLPSLEMGLGKGETKYSFSAPDQPIPYEANPRLIFDRMFRGRQPETPVWARAGARASVAVAKPTVAAPAGPSLDQSVLDLVLDESKSLRGKLGSGDQQRLDEYMESVRAVEVRVAQMNRQQTSDSKDMGIAKSGLVLPKNLPADATVWKDDRPMMSDPERHADYIRLLSDLMILAFQTDTTRVCTFAVGSDGAYFPGVVTVGYERHCHTLEHQGNAARPDLADPISREACRQIHEWYTSLFADMIRKMKSIDDGGVSLLDNSMLLFTSYMADGGHGRKDYPCLLAGKAQGTIKTGRHLAFEKDTPVANLYLEMIQRMGSKADEFGDSKTAKTARYNGRLPGLA